ncbi:MAG: LysM peptidoglycan-binding domain-containing protein [Treponema sp.]|nr:LysM peptidoglycan-binding domain-containing protein [Treponema sp.]
MGGDFLRRAILKTIFFLAAVLVCFGWAGVLPAAGAEGEALFSRPVRGNRSAPSPERIAIDQGRLAPPFLPGNSLLLLPGALESPLTQRYIQHNATPGGRASLAAIMRRAGPYLAFIRQKIAYMDLPPELVYLPVIESAYLRTAVSRSGAAGLWQFMENSISPFDIRVTEWMDQRRDFWKSTDGALRKLRGNYRVLGDWPLALAAYNAGLGGTRRLMQSSGIQDYWILSERGLLREETLHYVPRLIAAAYVLSSQRRFGIVADWPEDPQWQRIPAGGRSIDLAVLAQAAGVDAQQLIWANQELVYAVTPPEPGFYLKVRGADAQRIAAALARDDVALLRYHVHTIRPGDTLLSLARHFGVTVNQVHAANPGIQERYLRIGSRLRIPALGDDSVGPYQRAAPAREHIAFDGIHLVKRGETLWSLARAYGVDPEVLAEANGMQITDILHEGRVLRTPILQ